MSNKQNLHIQTKLREALAAVDNLVANGMTVTSIKIEGPRPRIDLLRSYNNRRLPVAWKRICGSSTGRHHEMAALVDGCEIIWTEEEH